MGIPTLGETLYTSRYYPVARVHRYLQWSWPRLYNTCQREQTEVPDTGVDRSSGDGAEMDELDEVGGSSRRGRAEMDKSGEADGTCTDTVIRVVLTSPGWRTHRYEYALWVE
jgi:hypothetical protein